MALEEENKRRRDECIQLRSILAQRSHSSLSKMNGISNNIDHSDENALHESELLQAFEAQKVVNRQLESELTALTEEHNSKISDLNKDIDELRAERNQLQEIMYKQIRTIELSEEYLSLNTQDSNSIALKQQSIEYLMAEIKSISSAYVQVLVRGHFLFSVNSEFFSIDFNKLRIMRICLIAIFVYFKFNQNLFQIPCQKSKEIRNYINLHIFQEENSRMSKSIEKLTQENQILSKRLRQNGIDDSIVPSANLDSSPMILKRAPTYQGIFKYRAEDVTKLLQRLVDDLEPRVAKTLSPSLPAYIIFMCIRWIYLFFSLLINKLGFFIKFFFFELVLNFFIYLFFSGKKFVCRYTDIVNDDDQVRKLLTTFISSVKNIYRSRHDKQTTEQRAMWLVNMIKWVFFLLRNQKSISFPLNTFLIFRRLLNLLKQYGGLEEHMKLNTPTQNEQQLKNFDLSEYRQVVFTNIIVSYQQIIQGIQEAIKMHIVPAILDYDEMARGKQKGTNYILIQQGFFFLFQIFQVLSNI